LKRLIIFYKFGKENDQTGKDNSGFGLQSGQPGIMKIQKIISVNQ
jgi:hypothetical protein